MICQVRKNTPCEKKKILKVIFFFRLIKKAKFSKKKRGKREGRGKVSRTFTHP